MTKNVLITGGAGFIGSNFVDYFLKENSGTNVVVIDSLTYAGDKKNLRQHLKEDNFTFIKGDIRNRNLLEKVFVELNIDGVIHFAAESHVDNSIEKPDIFIQTNINGTFNLLDVAYKFWLEKPHKYKSKYSHCKFLHVSTDEVYGSLGPKGLFTEKTPYAPNSPYSASKASSDMIVRSFYKTYGLNVLVTNCSNNYGPRQHQEKLIPKIIYNALSWQTIPIYGDGKNIRDWLYVTDHCKGINLVFNNGRFGEVYNIGGNNEKTNLEIVSSICRILDKKIPQNKSYSTLIKFVEDRAGHDKRYAIDASKIKNELNWVPDNNFDSGIELTVDWYLSFFNK